MTDRSQLAWLGSALKKASLWSEIWGGRERAGRGLPGRVGDLDMDIQCQTECFINHAQSFIRFHSFIHSSNKLRTRYGWVVCEVLGTPETRGMTIPHSGGLVLSPVSSFSSPPFHSHGSATMSVKISTSPSTLPSVGIQADHAGLILGFIYIRVCPREVCPS